MQDLFLEGVCSIKYTRRDPLEFYLGIFDFRILVLPYWTATECCGDKSRSRKRSVDVPVYSCLFELCWNIHKHGHGSGGLCRGRWNYHKLDSLLLFDLLRVSLYIYMPFPTLGCRMHLLTTS